jgi:signal transduction histidine kinase
MGVVRRSWKPAMSVERTGRHGQAVHRSAQTTSAQTIAAVAALVVLIYAFSTDQYFTPRWPLTVTAVLLGLGLAAARLARGQAQRSAQSVAAVAALVVLTWGLSIAYLSPKWPLAVIAVLLGLGLVAGPLAQLVSGQTADRSAQTVAEVAALVVFIYAFSTDQYFTPRWPLTVTAVLLGLGLAAARLAQLAGSQAVQRSAQSVAAVAALVVLTRGLSIAYLSPRWPLAVIAVLLGLGLVAGPLAQLVSRPREKMLSARVDELSRTRRGALDVQASELRRIERDLHDGAQVRLVALSMKLGRAEERYRDDAETAAFLREAREDAAAAIRELRELARGIAPPVLTDRGLEAAVRSLAQRSGAEVSVSGELERRPRPAVEIAAYFVVAESLTNAAKHARGARVEVRLDERGGDLFVEVTDFGPGGAKPAGGGLAGLRQRVEALDGALHVTSPTGVGTQIEAVLPCEW